MKCKGLCGHCKQELTQDNCALSTLNSGYGFCRECRNVAGRLRYKRKPDAWKRAADKYLAKPGEKEKAVHRVILRLRVLKQQIFEKLGRSCSCCGFSDARALQIDHVNGDGFKERNMSPISYLKKVLADESGAYQILCANCNWIKRHENSEHVHRQI